MFKSLSEPFAFQAELPPLATVATESPFLLPHQQGDLRYTDRARPQRGEESVQSAVACEPGSGQPGSIRDPGGSCGDHVAQPDWRSPPPP